MINMVVVKKKKKSIIKKKVINKVKKIGRISKVKKIGLKRFKENPIITPRFYAWESKATFNPSAFSTDDKIHLIYRAIGDNDSSVLGYASSLDGLNIIERSPYCVYNRSNNFSKSDISNSPIDYISGGGWSGGSEDPRLTLIDGTVYMLYTAFDGWGSVRIALTSIKLEDFENKKWKWKNFVFISPPGEIHKNWVIFPEKINGKYAILHSISPNISIDYVEDFNFFNGKNFIKSVHSGHPKWQERDKNIRGVGPVPIKTKLGWLILYHISNDGRYKLSAMILDKKDPTKILYRSKTPILEPEEYYENHGYKSGVVYSCGAVVKNDTLFVYYGGADKVVCVASIKLNQLLEDLKKHKEIKLKKTVLNI